MEQYFCVAYSRLTTNTFPQLGHVFSIGGLRMAQFMRMAFRRRNCISGSLAISASRAKCSGLVLAFIIASRHFFEFFHPETIFGR
jgi:hypothetical protein